MTYIDVLAPSIDQVLCVIALLAVLGSFAFALDDLFIDTIAAVKKLKPHCLQPFELAAMKVAPRKRIAILIANWHEENVLERMIAGNLKRVDYTDYVLFLGVYPNDQATLEIAKQLAERDPRVRAIVNSRPGPTTKGQMLNEMVRRILNEESPSSRFDLFLIQDSEDVLHPLSLQVINFAANDADFIQIPVFSFDVASRSLVGGTYLDEFAEVHTKDLLVREALGAAIPSAGVGTALSRNLVLAYLTEQNGNLLAEDTLTEDYHLGLVAKERGFKSRFVCTYQPRPDGSRDFVATREYFPAGFRAAIRQKARWTLGIAYQGSRQLGWRGTWVDRYFLFRDRKGPWNAILILFGWLTIFFYVLAVSVGFEAASILQSETFATLATLNVLNMTVRIVQRARCVWLANGSTQAPLVPVRWLVGNVVNTFAAYRATRTHIDSILTGAIPVWEKTAHVLPKDFGCPETMPAGFASQSQIAAPRALSSVTRPELRAIPSAKQETY